LQREYDLCADNEGVDAEMRVSRMRAARLDPDVPAVGSREQRGGAAI
jgi:hypothetical protein